MFDAEADIRVMVKRLVLGCALIGGFEDMVLYRLLCSVGTRTRQYQL